MSAALLAQLFETKNFSKLQETLDALPVNSVVEILDQTVSSITTNNTGNDLNVLKAILFGYGNDGSKHSMEILHLYKKSIELLELHTCNTVLTELICILNNEANNLTTNSLSELCSILLNKVKNGHTGQHLYLKLFQKLLDVVHQHTSVKVNKSKMILTGSEYKHHVIEELCSCEWRKEFIIHLVNMLKDLRLNSSEADAVVHKLLFEMSKIEPQELPAFVFQILRLGSSCSKTQPILLGMINHFNALDRQALASSEVDDVIDEANNASPNRNELLFVEGTVLLYFTNSLKQNQFLGKALLKLLKNVKVSLALDILTPFFLALVLVLVRDSRFNDEAVTLIRSLVYKCLQDDYKIKSSKYLKDHAQGPPTIKKLLFKVVSNCSQGWEDVVHGLIDLGFNLMTFYGPKPGPFGKSFERKIQVRGTPQEDACNIGVAILTSIFKAHKVARNEIISQLLNRIQISGNSPAYVYIELLMSIARHYPQALMQSSSQIKIMFDDLMVMHPHNVCKLLPALLPLLKINSSLRNSLVLVLRKALSSREVNSRLSALHGFLLILKNFPLTESITLSQVSSQSSQSIFSSQSSGTPSCPSYAHNRMLCVEILQALKRCLVQQCTVRTELYCGLHDVAKANLRLSSIIIESLLEHIKLFYEDDDDIIPPFSTDRCFDKLENHIQEPLHILLSLVHHVVRHAKIMSESDKIGEDDVLDEGLSNRVDDLFKSLTTRMCKSELEDFNIERNNAASSKSDTLIPGLLLSIYQVLMEYNYFQFVKTNEGANEILSLFQCYKKVMEATNIKQSHTEMVISSCTLGGLSGIVSRIFCDDANVDIHSLESCEDFLKHVVSTLLAMLQHGRDHGYFLGVGGFNQNEAVDEVRKAASACLHKFMVEKNAMDRSSVTLPCLECFHAALQYMCAWHKDKVIEFVTSLCSDDATQQDSLSKLTKMLQRVTIPLVTSDGPLSANERRVLLELLSILDTMVSLASIHAIPEEIEQFTDWWRKLCVESKLGDVNCVKRLISSHLQTSFISTPHPELPFRDFSFDLHAKIGSVEEAEDSENTFTYQVVTDDNAHHMVPLVIHHLDRIISNVEWLLQHLKGYMVVCGDENKTDNDADEVLQERRRTIENSICVTICTISVGLLELALTSIGQPHHVESVINGFANVFTFLTHFTKYYLWLHQQGKGSIPSRYEKLISFIGSDLMRPVYGFIMHAQNLQCADGSRGQSEGKKKSTKKIQVPSNLGKAKILRESKSIARLVFSIEQQEHNLILLARRTKIDFMKSYHLPTSRDFRIRSDVIRMTMNEQEAEKDDDDDESDESSSKRSRMD